MLATFKCLVACAVNGYSSIATTWVIKKTEPMETHLYKRFILNRMAFYVMLPCFPFSPFV